MMRQSDETVMVYGYTGHLSTSDIIIELMDTNMELTHFFIWFKLLYRKMQALVQWNNCFIMVMMRVMISKYRLNCWCNGNDDDK